MIRLEKSIAHLLAAKLAPECGEILSDFRANRDGWVKMPDEFERMRQNLGLGEIYVLTYEDERRIYNCFFKSVFPENTYEEFKKLDDELLPLSEEERFSFVQDALITPIEEADWDSLIPKTEEEIAAVKREFDSLSEAEQAAEIYKARMLIIFGYSFFYNSLSLMVHGQKLTTLVPLAMQGDKVAFCKAVQIDRNLLTGHPYFKETYAKLQAGEDRQFLKDLLYRIGNPTARGKIRYPALYMVFTILESFHWLDDFTASEILDICDEANLDRFQNRIEDENYLNKRRIEYRAFQKLNSSSMH